MLSSGGMLGLYGKIADNIEFALEAALRSRLKKGKELPERIHERRGVSGRERPPGPLIWVHGSSVGEAQAALILINRLLRQNPAAHILVTTGTASSARTMEKSLPARAFHQFYPWDRPAWVKAFLDHWRPDFAVWMESEIWPNMLLEVRDRKIPAFLVNARLSDKSFRRWKLFKSASSKILSAFAVTLAQTEEDARRFSALGARGVRHAGNIKYSAAPLSCDESDLKKMSARLTGRQTWLFASTHKGEEGMACRIHKALKDSFPDLLTIIAPRHPERREEIKKTCEKSGLRISFRGKNKEPPAPDADIYIADTMGEMGLLYRLAPVACIGRSFSDDGGGGHNPIEAAQLRCAVLHGPNVQFQKSIYDEMDRADAASMVRNENDLTESLRRLLTDRSYLTDRQQAAFSFARAQEGVVERVIEALNPVMAKTAR